jgi:hypothetical protein
MMETYINLDMWVMMTGDFQISMNELKTICIRLADTVFRRQYRNIEHRRFIRLSNYLPAVIRLVGSDNGRAYSKKIQGSTINISREGLCVESSTATVDGVDIFNDAMSPDRCLEIEIDLTDSFEKIKVCGNVVWLDMTPKDMSFLFKAGIHLVFQNHADKEIWDSFVARAKKYRRSQSRLIRTFKKLFK